MSSKWEDNGGGNSIDSNRLLSNMDSDFIHVSCDASISVEYLSAIHPLYAWQQLLVSCVCFCAELVAMQLSREPGQTAYFTINLGCLSVSGAFAVGSISFPLDPNGVHSSWTSSVGDV
jgi:hypothetical protein